MNNKGQNQSLMQAETAVIVELQTFENKLLEFLADRSLPTERVLVSVEERGRVFRNIDSVMHRLDESRLLDSTYISKFLAAAASGLFDAALNYLWDETIFELRRRVANYDLSYFFDIAVKAPERRNKLREVEDLAKVEDSELINAANELGLISDLGLKHLDFIRYMRNWASAAHPNQNEISGLQLIAWLETCINEVIALPESTIVGQIKRILTNIKSNILSEQDVEATTQFFPNLDQDRANALISGFFGLYVDTDSVPHIRQNVVALAPRLWNQVDNLTRQQFGMRYAQYSASADTSRSALARQFLEAVGGLAYIPDDMRAVEIQNALSNLLTAHRAPLNNFYTEPPLAQRLVSLVNSNTTLPLSIETPYIIGLVEVFLTNGNGEAWNADPYYIELLSQLDARQALIAASAFKYKRIAIKLQHQLCMKKFLDLLVIVRRAVTAPVVLDLFDAINNFTGPLSELAKDSKIRNKLSSVETVMGV
jgi:hypothetical protein